MRLPALVAALAALLVMAAPASAADPIPGASYEGTTEDGNPFSFKVSPDGAQVTDVLGTISIVCTGSQGGVEVSAFNSKLPFTVSEGTITGEDTEAWPWLYDMAGTFTSPSEAAGSLRVQFNKFDYSGGGLTICSRTFQWTAKTSAAAPGGGGGGEVGSGPTPEPGGPVDSGPTPAPPAVAPPTAPVANTTSKRARAIKRCRKITKRAKRTRCLKRARKIRG